MTSPKPPIPRAYRLTVVGSYLGQRVINSLGYLEAAGAPPPNNARATSLATGLMRSWRDNILPVQVPDYLLISVEAYSMQDPTVAGQTSSLAGPGRFDVGGVTNRNMPGFVAANVRLVTDRRGRQFRGRTGLCGLPEDQVDGNQLSSGYRDQIKSAFDSLRFDMRNTLEPPGASGVEVNGELAVVSETYLTATPVTGVVVPTLLGTRVTRLR